MNRKNQFMRIAISALLSALMSGAAVCVLFSALQLPCGVAGIYLSALAASALAGLATVSGPMAVLAAIGGIALLGGASMAHPEGFAQTKLLWSALTDPAAATPVTELAEAGALLGVLAPALLGAVLFALVDRRETTALALLAEFSIVIVSYALSPSLSLWQAVPGLIAGLAAFALAGDISRNAGALRVMIPATIAVCVALAIVPPDGTVWEPMQQAADRVRAAFEDYFRFTHERVPFTIGSEGYDHAAEVDGNVVARLGGPATPDPAEVMRVTADGDVLLRGSIRREYTGGAWVDTAAKARYLYIDFTRIGIRRDVFDMENNDAFAPVQVSVEILDEGTSTLFVPGRLEDFSMDPDTAVYYNSVGEMFLARNVQAGDEYSLIGYGIPDAQALREAVAAAQESEDDEYDQHLQTCTRLPEGIEDGVYALTMELTQDAGSAADKALAIQSWLRNHCMYTLEVDYPDPDRDFVSQFVLDTREGYCSYFASAMTVMCRIAGLPARYVEGYSVRADGEPQILTGEDAHAWTEVYFNGLGWVAFDPANGSGGGTDGLSDETEQGDGLADPTDPPESGDPEATMPPAEDPTIPPDDGTGGPTPTPRATVPPDESNLEPTPSPTPEPEDWVGGQKPTPAPSTGPEEPVTDQAPDADDGTTPWLWLLVGLLILLLLAAAVLLVRRRLAMTDPIRLSANAAEGLAAVLILYRSTLTLLRHAGFAPMNGETPSAFASRVCAQMDNPEFGEFTRAVERSVYARGDSDEQTVALGQRAYLSFFARLRRMERLRFTITRLTRGLGRFESIP